MGARGRTLETWLTRFVLAALFVAFTCVYPYIAAVNNPNENVRTYMTMAIVDDHTFKIDGVVQRNGWVNDMAKAPDREGVPHLYSVKAPAVSYAGVPVYWLFKKLAPRYGVTPADPAGWLRAATFVLRFVVVQLPCFFFVVWFARFLRRYTTDPVLRLSAVIAMAAGTNYLAYSLMFASHAPFAAAAFTSFALITRERDRLPRERSALSAFGAGFFAGLVTLLEYHGLPVSLGLALYALFVFYRPTRLASFGVGGIINALALMYFQWKAFGNPLTPGHKMVENQAFAAYHHKGLFGMSMPNGQVFKDISLSHAFGFFGTSPFMWLGLIAVVVTLVLAHGNVLLRKHMTSVATSMALMLALWLTVSSAIIWRGGWTIGPRYLGAAPPFFAFAAVVGGELFSGTSIWRRTLARGAFVGLCIASVFQIGLVGLLYNTLPESVTRPFAQVVLPLARAGFVPHHLGELFGSRSPTFWFVVVALLLAGIVLLIVVPTRERPQHYAVRFAAVALFAYLGLVPAFAAPAPAEGGDGGMEARRSLTAIWEPSGRDYLTMLRRNASRAPCLWYRVADLERGLGQVGDADRDEKRAGRPREHCR
jgi:hypothetical protein